MTILACSTYSGVDLYSMSTANGREIEVTISGLPRPTVPVGVENFRVGEGVVELST